MRDRENNLGAASKPILRWAGSKRRLLPTLMRSVPPDFKRYIEPFAGSACLFFLLRPPDAVLSDINHDLINFYRAVRWRPAAVLKSASSYPRSASAYYRLRTRFKEEIGSVSRAALFLYLNRLCFNGIFRTNACGHFNVPIGSRTGEFPTISDLRVSTAQLRKAQLLCGDYKATLNLARRGDFVYLDPPYAQRGQRNRGEYGPCAFSAIDLPNLQHALFDLDRRGVVFLLSYISCEEIQPFANRFSCSTVPVIRSVAGRAHSRVTAQELLIKNY